MTQQSVVEASPWAPLGQRGFRLLWPAVLVSYVGTWMQTVGAQWLLVNSPGGGASVALVQTAATLPVMLMAFPAGVLADAFDRRWLLFTVQAYVFAVAGTLAVLTAAGLVTPPLMLVFTFLLGLGAAVQLPTWQAVLPEVVPRHQLGAATRLEMVGVNFGRSAGPALAGVVIAVSGVPAVFALNAASVLLLAISLLRWRRSPATTVTSRERFVPAVRAGTRYIWNEPIVRRILARTALFIAPATVLWALLPLVARDRLGVGAGGYGALFAALGVGAVVAALVMGRLRSRLSTNALLALAGLIEATALALIVLIPSFVAVMATLVFAGLAWTAVVSTLNAELQLFLPGWVRARGLPSTSSSSPGLRPWPRWSGVSSAATSAYGQPSWSPPDWWPPACWPAWRWPCPPRTRPARNRRSTGRTYGWPSTPSPRRGRCWCRSTTRWPTNSSRTS